MIFCIKIYIKIILYLLNITLKIRNNTYISLRDYLFILLLLHMKDLFI